MSSTNRGATRMAGDLYETPAWCTEAILPFVLPTSNWVLEPAAGRGAILRVFRALAPAVPIEGIEINADNAQHCRDQGFQVTCADSLEAMPAITMSPGLIITNPPFSLALEFCAAALKLAAGRSDVAMLLRLNFLAGQRRSAWHRAHPSDVYVLPRRPSFTGNGTDSCEYAWFVWGPARGGRWQILSVPGATRG